MEQYVGLDVSVEETSVCVIDGAGKTIRELTTEDAFPIQRVGLEAGPRRVKRCPS